MQFGRRDLPKPDPDAACVLPGPDPRSASLLAPHRPPGPGARPVRVGGPSWNEGFVATYGPGVPPGQRLARYAERYGAVELNPTFHAVPSPTVTAGWRRAVPLGFRFAPKVPRSISHGGADWAAEVPAFLAAVEALEEARGPCFFQAPPEAGPGDLPELRRRLAALAPVGALALEVRHPGFFRDGLLVPPLFDALAAANIGTVVTDTPGRRDVVHSSLTAPFLLVRFMADVEHPSTAPRLAAWATHLAARAAEGLGEVLFFVHQPDNLGLPALIEAAEAALGPLLAPRAPPRQASLFG